MVALKKATPAFVSLGALAQTLNHQSQVVVYDPVGTLLYFLYAFHCPCRSCAYFWSMPRSHPPTPPAKDSLSVEVGGWFAARATGAGVVALPIVVLLLAAAGLALGWLGG